MMFLLTRRIAERCAPAFFMAFLLIGLLIGAPRPRASAQEVSASTLSTYSRPPVPVAQKYVPWASAEGSDSSAPSFSLSSRTTHIMMAVIVGTILLANIRLRPRKQTY